jgi:hypothetical protein
MKWPHTIVRGCLDRNIGLSHPSGSAEIQRFRGSCRTSGVDHRHPCEAFHRSCNWRAR